MNNNETNKFSSLDSRELEAFSDFQFELSYLLEKCLYISNLKTKVSSELEIQIFEFNYSSSKECILNAVCNLIDIAETMTNLSIYDSCPICDLKLGIRRIERRFIDNKESLRKSIKIGAVASEFYNSFLEMFELEAILRNKEIDNSQRIVSLLLRIFTD